MPEKTKTCKYCGETKAISCFEKNKTYADGHTNKCKDCRRAYNKEYRRANAEKLKVYDRQYYKKNIEKIRERDKEYYEKNKDKILKYHAEYRKKHKEELSEYFRDRYRGNRKELLKKMKEYNAKHREKKKKYLKEYYQANKQQLLKQDYARKKKRLKEDHLFKLKEQARFLIWRSFAQRRSAKPARSEEILGCSLDTFASHLKQTWFEKYHTEWQGQPCHIDHIKPLALAKTKEEIIQLCHYTNLRLLTPEDNIKKAKEDYLLARKAMIELIKEGEKYE